MREGQTYDVIKRDLAKPSIDSTSFPHGGVSLEWQQPLSFSVSSSSLFRYEILRQLLDRYTITAFKKEKKASFYIQHPSTDGLHS